MFIEYKIKFQKDGFILTECIEPSTTDLKVKPGAPLVQNSLGATFKDSQAANASGGSSASRDEGGSSASRDEGGSSASRDEGGTPILGTGPITLIGPFIFLDWEKNHGK